MALDVVAVVTGGGGLNSPVADLGIVEIRDADMPTPPFAANIDCSHSHKQRKFSATLMKRYEAAAKDSPELKVHDPYADASCIDATPVSSSNAQACQHVYE